MSALCLVLSNRDIDGRPKHLHVSGIRPDGRIMMIATESPGRFSAAVELDALEARALIEFLQSAFELEQDAAAGREPSRQAVACRQIETSAGISAPASVVGRLCRENGCEQPNPCDPGTCALGPEAAQPVAGAVAQPIRCPLCDYQHGHAIGCARNPVDIALKAQAAPAPEPSAQAVAGAVATEPSEEIQELRAQVEAWRKQCETLTNQVICCGVAARHPDATLTTRGAYAGKWNSPQAEEVRKLRAERDALLAASPQPAPSAQGPLTDEQIDNLRGLDTAGRVRFYEHDFYVLSNFSAFTLQWKGRRFDTSEAAYHWEKFADRDDEVQDMILEAPSAHEAFKIAESQRAMRRADWDNVKVGIMLDILRAKAAQHEYVRRKLLATGDRELVEDSWRDDFWGWGPNRDGKNMLGRLWMQVRGELRGIAPKAAQEKT